VGTASTDACALAASVPGPRRRAVAGSAIGASNTLLGRFVAVRSKPRAGEGEGIRYRSAMEAASAVAADNVTWALTGQVLGMADRN